MTIFPPSLARFSRRPLQSTRRLLSCALILVLSLLLGACSGLLKSDQPVKQLFMLHPLSPPSSSTVNSQAEPLPLVISARVVPGLDTDRILVLGPDSSLTPVANARWADNLPEVISSVVRRSLSLSGRYAPEFDGPNRHRQSTRLQLELQAFYGTRNYDAETERVEIMIEGRIECLEAKHAIRISRDTAVGGTSLTRIVSAHQRVLDEAMEELLSLLDTHCSNT